MHLTNPVSVIAAFSEGTCLPHSNLRSIRVVCGVLLVRSGLMRFVLFRDVALRLVAVSGYNKINHAKEREDIKPNEG